MTEREQENLRVSKEKIFDRDKYTCICGESIFRYGRPQLAHVIKKSKMNIKKYGEDVVHHELNLVSVCSLECNAKADLGYKPSSERALVQLIMKELGK